MDTITEADRDMWKHFLNAVAPVILDHLGEDANIVIGAQFGSMLDDDAPGDACVVTSNMPTHETSAAIHDMSVAFDKVAKEQARQDEIDEAAMLALFALLTGDDEAIHVAAQHIAETDPDGWAAADNPEVVVVLLELTEEVHGSD